MRCSFSHTALCASTLCPFQGAICGAHNTRRAFTGLYPVKPDGGHISRAFATILSNRCVLFARWGVAAALPCLAERPAGRSSSSTSVYPVVSCVGHFGGPGH